MGEQKILCTAYNMKLQFIFLASTLALTFSKNIPVPALDDKTKKNVNKLAKNAVKQVQTVLKENGVEVKNLQGKIDNALNAGSLQVKNVKGAANQEYNKVAGKTVGELIDIAANSLIIKSMTPKKMHLMELKFLSTLDKIFLKLLKKLVKILWVKKQT